MNKPAKSDGAGVPRLKTIIQRRISPRADHLRPQRWNWSLLARPIDRSVERAAQHPLDIFHLRNLRYFWLDGLFAALSENFYLGFVALFALAYGAANSQVGWLVAGANLFGALALFPGARLVEGGRSKKAVVVWSAGIFGRFALLALALVPAFFADAALAVTAIILLNCFRAFMSNLANPGWTALVAEIVPDDIRARFFSSRNIAMGVAALSVAPLAGWLISQTNARAGSPVAGYQVIFLIAFLFGMVSTIFFARIQESPPGPIERRAHQRGDLRRALRNSPGFAGLVLSALVWNLALQMAAPFFNVYLVGPLGATATAVGVLAGIASLSSLFGQRFFAVLLDRRGPYWVQGLAGLIIPFAPLAWALVAAPWQVGLINACVGFLWAGYNLANFNLLLELTPDDQRARAVAFYQAAVFGSAVVGPLIGGYLADVVGFKLVFILSSIGRFAGTGLFLGLTVRPRRALALSVVKAE